MFKVVAANENELCEGMPVVIVSSLDWVDRRVPPAVQVTVGRTIGVAMGVVQVLAVTRTGVLHVPALTFT